MFTLGRDGRINFYQSEGSCSGGWVINAEYGGHAFRPTITLAPPRGHVLTQSALLPFPDDAIPACFDGTGAIIY